MQLLIRGQMIILQLVGLWCRRCFAFGLVAVVDGGRGAAGSELESVRIGG